MNTLSSEFVNSWIKMGIDQVLEKLAGSPLGADNVTRAIAHAMEVIDTMPCTGPLKADFVVAIVDALVQRMPDSDDKTNMERMSASGWIRDTIAVIAKATKGEIHVNKIADSAGSSCFQKCCPRIWRKSTA